MNGLTGCVVIHAPNYGDDLSWDAIMADDSPYC